MHYLFKRSVHYQPGKTTRVHPWNLTVLPTKNLELKQLQPRQLRTGGDSYFGSTLGDSSDQSWGIINSLLEITCCNIPFVSTSQVPESLNIDGARNQPGRPIHIEEKAWVLMWSKEAARTGSGCIGPAWAAMYCHLRDCRSGDCSKLLAKCQQNPEPALLRILTM